MKGSLVVINALLGGIIFTQVDTKFAGSSPPILQYFAATKSHGDGKGVTIVLHEKDRKRFAELTHKYAGQVLVCMASDDVFLIGIITSPTDDGIIEFSEARYTGNIAECLRRRFGK